MRTAKTRPGAAFFRYAPNCGPSANSRQTGGILAKTSLLLALLVLVFIISLTALAVISSFSSSPGLLADLSSLPHEREVQAASEKHGIDPCLVYAVISAESGGQPGACSPAGARGLMQIMPETGQWCATQMGLRDFSTEQLHDPAVNIDMGCWYLKHLYGEFNGNETAVIAAYNAGLANVKDWMASGIWDGTMTQLDQIPYSETRQYVRTVHDSRLYFQNRLAKANSPQS